MAVAIRLLSAAHPTPRLSEKMLSVTVTLGYSLTQMDALVQPSPVKRLFFLIVLVLVLKLENATEYSSAKRYA